MKKVLFIGITPPEEGGSERHIYEVSSRMPEAEVLTQKGSSCKRKIELPVLHLGNFIRNISFALMCYIYAVKLLLKKEHELVHIHENLLYFLAPILRARYEVVVTVHGIKGFGFYDKKIRWFFFKLALKGANRLIAVNTEDKTELEREFGLGKIVYIPNGVDLKNYTGREAVEDKISFIGRMHEQKGIVYLLKAFREIEKKYPEFKLEMIGRESEYSEKLKNDFNSKGVIWRGFISDKKKIAKLLMSAYCIVLPSLWEGLPLTLFESLASKRPVIVSDIPAFRSVVKNEVLFSKAKDSEDLAGRIKELIEDKLKAKTLGLKGYELSKEYDWKNIAKRTQQIYQEV